MFSWFKSNSEDLYKFNPEVWEASKRYFKGMDNKEREDYTKQMLYIHMLLTLRGKTKEMDLYTTYLEKGIDECRNPDQIK